MVGVVVMVENEGKSTSWNCASGRPIDSIPKNVNETPGQKEWSGMREASRYLGLRLQTEPGGQ